MALFDERLVPGATDATSLSENLNMPTDDLFSSLFGLHAIIFLAIAFLLGRLLSLAGALSDQIRRPHQI